MITEYNKLLQQKFNEMSQSGKLFRVKLTGDEIWDLYIKSFRKIDDPIFRDPTSTVHTCNNCKNFIRRYANVVSIDENYNIQTMFDVDFNGMTEYTLPFSTISSAIKKSVITEVFFETYRSLNALPYESCSKSNSTFKLGIAKNTKMYSKEEAERYGVVQENQIETFHHFHLSLDKKFVDMSDSSIESILGKYRDDKNVFQRAMETISLDTLNLVKDLILQGSLLDGQTHLFKIQKMIPLKEDYDSLPLSQKDNWCWINSYEFPFARFRNELIGVLCTELAEGKELNEACMAWNRRVDPVNYMKTTAPITKRQIEDAKKFIEENGYEESFNRRHATMDDIRVSEILHSNTGNGQIKSVSIFDGIKPTSTRHKRTEFDSVEEIHIDKFMKDILPTCTAVEAFVQNNHANNFVSLTTAKNLDSKPIFKWDNNYSWTFNGNLAGKSQIKDAVKSKGGKIDGVLRFSITWNEDKRDIVDLDAHAQEPVYGDEIYYGRYKGYPSSMSGMLDVDMIRPTGLGVENIVWSDISKMKDGVYQFWVVNFDSGQNKGFKAEIEFDGEIYCYEHKTPVLTKVSVAEVTLKNKRFTIKHILPESQNSSTMKTIYGIDTNQFHKITLICNSPNHWGDNQVGNKHYFFMLENCRADVPIRSFHNENLLPELAEHRKVLEVLGASTAVEPTKDQLSGLGFNATVRDELILKLHGSHKRVVKIKF